MFGDIGKMMKMASQMKGRMQAMQAELEASEYSAQAGGSAVSATVNGKKELIDITIDPQVLADGDAEMLADLVKAAVASAQQAASEAATEAMKELTGGMDLPPGIAGMMP